MIGLVDGNNFYVSCERIFNPALEGKPVAVLSNNDGCVISRSYEFKALAIPMGTPYFQLEPLIPKLGLILKSSNYELYGDISRRVISVLAEFTPDVEQYSIDEAFIHVNLPPESCYHAFGQQIRSTILDWVGIPCGVGFAPSKTLAKIANHIAKKRPGGVFVMPADPQPVLANLPVSDVWGVGPRLAPKLLALGIRSAWNLASCPESILRRHFNVNLARTSRELRGESVISRDDPDEPSRSISCSRSFGRPVLLLDELSQAVAHYSARAAVKLRKENQLAVGANVFFQYFPEFSPSRLDGGFTSTTIAFPFPTSATPDILKAILPKLKGIFLDGRRYKKAGVVFFGLEAASNRQLDLFADSSRDEKSSRLDAAMDAVNSRFGKHKLFTLAEGIAKPWAMKREFLTPNFTTSWDNLPAVN